MLFVLLSMASAQLLVRKEWDLHGWQLLFENC